MSCTDDDEQRCDNVLHDVWMFLDDELDPIRRAAVQRHLDECSPCLEEAGIDSKLKALLARKCRGDHAPEQLRARITASLVQRRVVVQDGQRVDMRTSVTMSWEQQGGAARPPTSS